MSQHYQRLRPWVRTTSVAFSTGLLVAFLSMVLSACVYSNASIFSTLPQAQVAQPQTQTQIQTKVKNCGTVSRLGHLEVPVNDTGAAAAENCFWRAFQHCQPATLVFVSSSVDTSLIRTFVIHKNRGRCSIIDARQF